MTVIPVHHTTSERVPFREIARPNMHHYLGIVIIRFGARWGMQPDITRVSLESCMYMYMWGGLAPD